MKKLNVLLTVLAFLVLISPGHLLGADANIVKIFNASGDKPVMMLDPPDLYISTNTVVIWMNGYEGVEVQVSFDDGKACQDVTVSPTQLGFSMSQNCYVTSYIPYAATSSLKFTEAGTFKYTVSTQDGKVTTAGKIVVRDL